MSSLNKVLLIGNLGSDPETRFTPQRCSGRQLSLATSESWNDKDGQRQERTEWHRIVLWRRLAEIAGQYLKKGSKVYIEGKLQTRSWEDQQGAEAPDHRNRRQHHENARRRAGGRSCRGR